MKCPKCGNEAGNAKFCPECGAPLNGPMEVQHEEAYKGGKPKKKKGCGCATVFIVFFALMLIGGLLTAISPDGVQSDASKSSASSTASASSELNSPSAESSGKTEEEKQAEIDAAFAKLAKQEDEVENTAFYTPSCYPKYSNTRSFALPYIGEKDGRYVLIWKFNYTGSDWVFFNDVVINIDGEKAAEIPFNYFDVQQEVFTGGVFEAVDVNPANKYADLMQKIASSEKTIIRFAGKDYKYDMTVSDADKQGIQDILYAYNLVK